MKSIISATVAVVAIVAGFAVAAASGGHPTGIVQEVRPEAASVAVATTPEPPAVASAPAIATMPALTPPQPAPPTTKGQAATTLVPAPVAASTPRPPTCPVAGWRYRSWTASHETPTWSNPDVATPARLGSIHVGDLVTACARPDGWLAATGYGWVRPSDGP